MKICTGSKSQFSWPSRRLFVGHPNLRQQESNFVYLVFTWSKTREFGSRLLQFSFNCNRKQLATICGQTGTKNSSMALYKHACTFNTHVTKTHIVELCGRQALESELRHHETLAINVWRGKNMSHDVNARNTIL